MSKRKSKSPLSPIHITSLHKPEGAKEYTVDIGKARWTVYEFPFWYFKKLGGIKLKGTKGLSLRGAKVIAIDSELPKTMKLWVLRHEMQHAKLWESGVDIPDRTWDELTCELFTLAETSSEEYKFSTQREVLDALKVYLDGRPDDTVGQVIKLVKFLQEGAREPEKAEPRTTTDVPENPIPSG